MYVNIRVTKNQGKHILHSLQLLSTRSCRFFFLIALLKLCNDGFILSA